MRTARLGPGIRLASLPVLLLVAACGGHSGAGPAGGAATPAPRIPIAATVSPTASLTVTGTAVVSRVLSGPSPQITPDLADQVVQLPAGSFLVNLGGDVDWSVQWAPADAVRPVLTTTRPAGSQGYYTIDAPGRTVQMTASGPRRCSTPAAGAQPCTPGSVGTVRVTLVTGPAAP